MKIKPSAKIRRRYLLLEAPSKKIIKETILEYIGILGWAEASPKFISIKNSKEKILAIDRKALTKIRASFESSNKKIKVIKVTSTIKKLQNLK